MKSLAMQPFAHEEYSRTATRAGALARSLRKGFAAAALAVGSAAAFAGTNGITVSIDPLITPDSAGIKSVSYSPSATARFYAAYGAALSNPTNSNVQNAWLKVVTSTDKPGLKAPFDPSQVPANCAIDASVADNTALICTFSQAELTPPGVAFTILIPTPQAPAGGAAASLSLLWTLQAGQGKSDANPSNVVQQQTQAVVMKVGSPTDVRTWVRSGDKLKVASTAGTSTEVKPPLPVTVGLKQDTSASSCSSQYKQCFESTVRIVDNNSVAIAFGSPFISIDFFRPASSLKKNADINNAVLFYREVFPNNTVGVSQQIVPCINGPAWEIPTGSDRCLVPAFPVNTLTFADSSGFHLHVIARKNGIINW